MNELLMKFFSYFVLRTVFCGKKLILSRFYKVSVYEGRKNLIFFNVFPQKLVYYIVIKEFSLGFLIELLKCLTNSSAEPLKISSSNKTLLQTQ